MKILLIQPPIQDFYDTDIRLQPLGLCMLKAVVRERLPEVDVVVKDYHQGHGKRDIPMPHELAYLKEYYAYRDKGPFSTFHGYSHFGASFDVIAREVWRENPDLIGISSLFSPYHREASACAREIKKLLNSPVVMGGSHVSAMPVAVLEDPNVDFVVCGEGERPFVEFVTALLSGSSFEKVPGLGFKRNGKPILNAPQRNFTFEDLPPPDFSDLPPERYRLGKKPLCFITTTRGCPHRCEFCSVHLTFKEGFRQRRPAEVMSEIEKRYAAGYRVFDFEDDNLSFHKGNFKELLSLIGQRWPAGEIRCTAMNGISYLSLDEEILSLMKQAGFRDLNLSLVSAEEQSLAAAKRPHTVRKFMETVEQAHSLGFQIVAYQIVGLPYETREMMVMTMVSLTRLPLLLGVSIFYMTPGSPISGKLVSLNDTDPFKARSTAMAIETDKFCRDELYTLFITARIINFLKGLKIGEGAVSLKHALEFAGIQGKRARTGAELLKRLLDENKLYAATARGHLPLSRFRPDLFSELFEKAEFIRTNEGGTIRLSGS
ncbi:MAG: radical SAM protein [Desulfobacteraceae bacterium]|nr:MAG: radical SAM protein [Desulfobacteraceae bacterium]